MLRLKEPPLVTEYTGISRMTEGQAVLPQWAGSFSQKMEKCAKLVFRIGPICWRSLIERPKLRLMVCLKFLWVAPFSSYEPSKLVKKWLKTKTLPTYFSASFWRRALKFCTWTNIVPASVTRQSDSFFPHKRGLWDFSKITELWEFGGLPHALWEVNLGKNLVLDFFHPYVWENTPKAQ